MRERERVRDRERERLKVSERKSDKIVEDITQRYDSTCYLYVRLRIVISSCIVDVFPHVCYVNRSTRHR